MDWLTPTDEAMKTLALRQAEEIEKAIDRAEELEAIVTASWPATSPRTSGCRS
jgi:hypothetical protein